MTRPLKEVREDKLLTMEELAAIAGISRATVSRIEAQKHRPHISTRRRIAKALKVRPKEITEFVAGSSDEGRAAANSASA